jgi:hypothetical protein
MSPAPSPLNPSQAVERIREIIVGRHLERLEQRVAHLETGPSPSHVPVQWEDRLCTHEARLEALQQALQRLTESTRTELESRSLQQREEIQRLVLQIQQVAALKASETAQPAIDQLERKIGTWLNNWQGALHNHLNERDQRLASQLREEVSTLWENTESQITRLEGRMLDRNTFDDRFSRLAAAARALAECAAPSVPGPQYATL